MTTIKDIVDKVFCFLTGHEWRMIPRTNVFYCPNCGKRK